jgi:hypothetical protein
VLGPRRNFRLLGWTEQVLALASTAAHDPEAAIVTPLPGSGKVLVLPICSCARPALKFESSSGLTWLFTGATLPAAKR